MKDSIFEADSAFMKSMRDKLGIDKPFSQDFIDTIKEDIIFGVAKEKGFTKSMVKDILSNISIEMNRASDIELKGAIITWMIVQLPLSLQKLLLTEVAKVIEGYLMKKANEMDDESLASLMLLGLLAKTK